VTEACLAKRTRAGCATESRRLWPTPWPLSRVSSPFQSLARSMTGMNFKDVIAEAYHATALFVYRFRARSATGSELHSAEPGSEPTLIFRRNSNFRTRDI
jgi:hypothetical protein